MAGPACAAPALAASSRLPADIMVMAAQIDDLITLDPAELYELSGGDYVANVYDRLVRHDPDNVAVITGVAAEGWSVSPDGRRFTFRIRPGMAFHSGNPVTAEDAAWSLQRVVRLGKGPAFLLKQFGLDAGNVESRVRATDAHTLVFETDRTYAPGFVLGSLASWVSSVVDRKAALAHEKNGDLGNGWLRRASAGSGPFRLAVWRPNEALIVDRFDGYWQGAAGMRRVVLRHIPEPGTQRLLLEKGDVDIARNIGADDLAALSANPAVRIRHVERASQYYLGLNQKNPYLRRPEVRTALKYLTDYEAINDSILKGTQLVRQTFLPRGTPGAIDDRPYRVDVDKARALLAEAGLADGFAVTMDTRNTSPTTEIAEALQAMWGRAGIRVEILPGDNKQTLTRYRARSHDIYIGRWSPDTLDPHGNAEAFAWNPDNGESAAVKTLAWRNAWDTPETSRLVAAVLAEPDPSRRAAAYADLQRLHQRISPFVLMFQDTEPVAERTGITGPVIGPTFDMVLYRDMRKSRP
ncbi:MAG: ABC transporter substrate-binding protein [Alphaproteobacteria bacterium]